MEFLTNGDLHSHSKERFLDDSLIDFNDAKDNIELQTIALVRSKLNARYDVDEIFTQSGEDRHPLIVRCMSMIVIHDIIARNSARKVPEDINTNYKWAMKWLNDVRDRHENPDGLPPREDEDGNATRTAIWGNNKNEDNYL